jgi:hypothetical protein
VNRADVVQDEPAEFAAMWENDDLVFFQVGVHVFTDEIGRKKVFRSIETAVVERGRGPSMLFKTGRVEVGIAASSVAMRRCVEEIGKGQPKLC